VIAFIRLIVKFLLVFTRGVICLRILTGFIIKVLLFVRGAIILRISTRFRW